MQYQVPQFIEVEDKIFFGLLTIKQMAYFGAAFILSIIVHTIFPFAVFIILGVIFFGLAAAFSFVKINGVPFSTVLKSSVKFFWQPQVYVWRPDRKFLEEAEEPTGRSPQEKLAELKSIFKSKFKQPPDTKQVKIGRSKILVDQPLIRGFEEKVRQRL